MAKTYEVKLPPKKTAKAKLKLATFSRLQLNEARKKGYQKGFEEANNSKSVQSVNGGIKAFVPPGIVLNGYVAPELVHSHFINILRGSYMPPQMTIIARNFIQGLRDHFNAEEDITKKRHEETRHEMEEFEIMIEKTSK